MCVPCLIVAYVVVAYIPFKWVEHRFISAEASQLCIVDAAPLGVSQHMVRLKRGPNDQLPQEDMGQSGREIAPTGFCTGFVSGFPQK